MSGYPTILPPKQFIFASNPLPSCVKCPSVQYPAAFQGPVMHSHDQEVPRSTSSMQWVQSKYTTWEKLKWIHLNALNWPLESSFKKKKVYLYLSVYFYFWLLTACSTTGVQNNINTPRGCPWEGHNPVSRVHPVVTGHQTRPRAQPVTELQPSQWGHINHERLPRVSKQAGERSTLGVFLSVYPGVLTMAEQQIKTKCIDYQNYKEPVRRSGCGNFPATTWKRKPEIRLSWLFRDMNHFIYVHRRLNLYTQSEKFQVRPLVKRIPVVLNPSYTLQRLHNTHSMKHSMNTALRSSTWTMTTSHKNLHQRGKSEGISERASQRHNPFPHAHNSQCIYIAISHPPKAKNLLRRLLESISKMLAG